MKPAETGNKAKMDDVDIDRMDFEEAAAWLDKRTISYEHLESLDEMKLLIQQLLDQENRANRETENRCSQKVYVGFQIVKTYF